MKKILIILICILASCSTAKRCEKHIAKAKELGCLKESDSTKIVVKYITNYNKNIKSDYEIEKLKDFDEVLQKLNIC